jgi:hypothetical protein
MKKYIYLTLLLSILGNSARATENNYFICSAFSVQEYTIEIGIKEKQAEFFDNDVWYSMKLTSHIKNQLVFEDYDKQSGYQMKAILDLDKNKISIIEKQKNKKWRNVGKSNCRPGKPDDFSSDIGK